MVKQFIEYILSSIAARQSELSKEILFAAVDEYSQVYRKGGEEGYHIIDIRRENKHFFVFAYDLLDREKILLVFSTLQNGEGTPEQTEQPEYTLYRNFSGQKLDYNGIYGQEIPVSWENAVILHSLFPYTKPVSLRDKKTTFGCGDRLGLASPGHLKAFNKHPDLYPVLAQQSMRELQLTGRTYKDVVAEVTFHVFQEGFTRGYGADGDHLKTLEDIDSALDAEMPMITLDLSDHLQPEVMTWEDTAVKKAYTELKPEVRQYLEKQFLHKTWLVSGKQYSIDEKELQRCALMYWDALIYSKQVDEHIQSRRKGSYDLEISIDETTAATSPEQHLFIAVCLLDMDVNFMSLAPRFVGEFQKGIDYIGDAEAFEKQFEEHQALAEHFSSYKLSIHSGSDKYRVFPIIGRITDMRFHLKTSGTSWLEAVRVIAKKQPDLYRRIHALALDFFSEASSYYHVGCNPNHVAPLDTVADEDLSSYLDQDDARQLIHICYGGVLKDPKLASAVFQTLCTYRDELDDGEAENILRHINSLKRV